MRLIAISIIEFAGSVMAAAGTLAESMPDAKRYNIVDECGLAVVAVGILFFVGELSPWRPKGLVEVGGKTVGATSPPVIT